MSIPIGLCQCGCGGLTWTPPKSNTARGLVKGQPCRFLRGHGTEGQVRVSGERRILRKGRPMLRMRWHPRADETGYAYEHIIVAEMALGHGLPPGAVVHHWNEDVADNVNSNLAILPDNSYHLELHRRMRVLKAGGNPFTDSICRACHTIKPLDEFYRRPNGSPASRCKVCLRAYSKHRRVAA